MRKYINKNGVDITAFVKDSENEMEKKAIIRSSTFDEVIAELEKEKNTNFMTEQIHSKKSVMTKQELFKKYSIDESHNVWDNSIDNWMSVEVYRIMHNGELPLPDDKSVNWITEFLDKQNDTKWWVANVMSRKDWGSLYLTAKRMVYSLSEQILSLNN